MFPYTSPLPGQGRLLLDGDGAFLAPADLLLARLARLQPAALRAQLLIEVDQSTKAARELGSDRG